jgi:hypothetical protein
VENVRIEDAREWRSAGLDQTEIDNAIGFRLTFEEVREWEPFRALEIYWARKHGLPLSEARRWAAEGVPVRDTIMARAVGLSLDELHAWQARGFNASDAWEAKEAGVTIPQAVAWREAGFVAPDALQLTRDGWTLDEAVVARYAGLRRYARRSTHA